eukprot:442812-Amphidinium_carterae.1
MVELGLSPVCRKGGIPPLAITERVAMNVSDVHVGDEGLLAEFHSPQFGGNRVLAIEASGDGGGGGGGSGPSSSRGDPLHRKDPWHGAT